MKSTKTNPKDKKKTKKTRKERKGNMIHQKGYGRKVEDKRQKSRF
jgi:hypothetical protein